MTDEWKMGWRWIFLRQSCLLTSLSSCCSQVISNLEEGGWGFRRCKKIKNVKSCNHMWSILQWSLLKESYWSNPRWKKIFLTFGFMRFTSCKPSIQHARPASCLIYANCLNLIRFSIQAVRMWLFALALCCYNLGGAWLHTPGNISLSANRVLRWTYSLVLHHRWICWNWATVKYAKCCVRL